MKKLVSAILLTVLSVVANPAIAQTPPTYNCVTATCSLISDAFPATGTQPVSCKLYDGGTVLATTPVAGPVGAVYCLFPNRNFAAGNHTLTASAVAADGLESAQSAPFVFASAAPTPPPVPRGLRKQ